MKLFSIESKEEWNNYLKKNNPQFLQSWQWGEFRKNYQEVKRLGLYKDDLIGVCQIFTEKLPFGKYLYIPYGPVCNAKYQKEFLKLLFEQLKGPDFIRIEPLHKEESGKRAFSRHQPGKTLQIDLRSDLYSGFDKDIRYGVRRAKREGVRIEDSNNIEDFIFLLRKSSERQRFNTYDDDYFRKFLQIEDVSLFMAYHDDIPVSGALFACFGDRAFYLHAGLNYEKRSLCAPSLLNFEIMKAAKERGCSIYDFWGIDEEKMPGVTRFKKGFGGKEVIYPEARDITVRWKYILYKTAYNLKN